MWRKKGWNGDGNSKNTRSYFSSSEEVHFFVCNWIERRNYWNAKISRLVWYGCRAGATVNVLTLSTHALTIFGHRWDCVTRICRSQFVHPVALTSSLTGSTRVEISLNAVCLVSMTSWRLAIHSYSQLEKQVAKSPERPWKLETKGRSSVRQGLLLHKRRLWNTPKVFKCSRLLYTLASLLVHWSVLTLLNTRFADFSSNANFTELLLVKRALWNCFVDENIT